MIDSDDPRSTLLEARKVLEDVRLRLETERPDRGEKVLFGDAASLSDCQDLISHAQHLGQDADTALAAGFLDFSQQLLDLAFSYADQAETCLGSL